MSIGFVDFNESELKLLDLFLDQYTREKSNDPKDISRMLKSIQAKRRGILLLDRDLSDLAPALFECEIQVIKANGNQADDNKLKDLYLPDRIFVTARSTEFVDDASTFEYSIISCDLVSELDAHDLATMISLAIIENKFWYKAKINSWLLKLDPLGEHETMELPK